MLIKFSNVFYTDINLYDLNGELYATSRPEVFTKGLKSSRMHPKAFEAMTKTQKEEWVQDEQIGKMNYLSAYIPFKNYDNEVLAYLNLPYFAKQGSLQKEISTFLVSTINIYVGIFALALLVSVFLINQLSKPLLLIRQQIGRLKLGSTIELIEWDSNDEIGELVKEYNRIAVELSDSAEQLAQSERESAWREMAKQVAHEIKNPLTPMKLSIQHLQLAYKTNREDLGDRLEKTTNTLIEQIDTLSNIANAFSSFAKMPEQKKEKVVITDLLQSVINLYKNDSSISLEYDEILKDESMLADRSQLIRLFNNLIKNAIQATESIPTSAIFISLFKKNGNILIEIKDNGVGVPEEIAARIFEPNFTSKTSGTGLGLAMSKSIVEQLDGTISFSSELGVGTVFRIEFSAQT
jgi:nitrogen fixation/metabolism regulation signal transduction histidine kinase